MTQQVSYVMIVLMNIYEITVPTDVLIEKMDALVARVDVEGVFYEALPYDGVLIFETDAPIDEVYVSLESAVDDVANRSCDVLVEATSRSAFLRSM